MGNKTKVVLAILGILILLGGLFIGLILVRRRQEIREKAAPATTLLIIPSTQSGTPGQSVDFSIIVDTGENLVIGFDIDLKFNPSAITINSLQRGSGVASFSQVIRNNIDNSQGVINYSAFTLEKTKVVQGSSVEVMRIAGNIKPSATAGTYSLSFAPTTAVAGVAEGQNVLVGKTPGNVVVLGVPAPSSTPTPIVTPSPTPPAIGGGADYTTPSLTPSLTPTPTPTPTPSQTVAPTETLPEAGVSYPTIIGLVIGLFLLIGSLVLAI